MYDRTTVQGATFDMRGYCAAGTPRPRQQQYKDFI